MDKPGGEIIPNSTRFSPVFPSTETSARYDKDTLGLIDCNGGPAHQRFVTVASRLETFDTWPPGLTQKPKEMVEAGFFYVGRSDQVKCFYCNGGLESWQPEDSAIEEHRKWFPSCTYLMLLDEDKAVPLKLEPPGASYRQEENENS